MQPKVERVDGLFPDSGIRLAMVQLKSPFTPDAKEIEFYPNLEPPQFQWINRDKDIPIRKAKISNLLDYLRSRNMNINILVFPEYAVPKDCHEILASYAKERKCIVIAGSYYETDNKSRFFRNNLSTIFLPNLPQILIAKRHAFSHEQQAMGTSTKLPNIARLIWSPSSGKSYSISIYLCRDYLIPYQETKHNSRVSQLDWENPGLNIVVMSSADTSLFKGLAALDVRRMRGMGKFVALSNCSNIHGDGSSGEGSMLLGPTETFRRERDDIITSLPADVEGMILAEIDLDSVALIEEKPNTHIRDPLKYISKYTFGWDKDYSKVYIKSTYKPSIRERGVFQPAFLELMNRDIAIELLSTESYLELKNILESRDVCWISVATLRGIHDIMIRSYPRAGWEHSAMCMPYCKLNEAEIDRLLPKDTKITLVVRPRTIYKYRTVPIPPYSPEAWEKKKDQIKKKLSSGKERRKELLSRISRLARDWNTKDINDDQRRELADVFLESREITPLIDHEQDKCLRQTYVLIMILSPETLKWEVFYRDIVRGYLNSMQEVRSVYGVETVVGNPRWDYWLDIVAAPFRTDEILLGLYKMCKEKDIRFSTRSMDVVEHLRAESVEGIERSDWGDELKDFIIGLKAIEEPFLRSKLDFDLIFSRLEIAKSFATAFVELVNLPVSCVDQEVSMKVLEFYGYWLTGNFTNLGDVVKKYLDKASDAWLGIFRRLETAAGSLLKNRFGENYREALKEHFKNAGKEDRIGHILGNEMRAMFELFAMQNSEYTFDNRNMKELRKQLEPVYLFRDDLTHKDERIRALDLRGKKIDDGLEIVNRISSHLKTVVETLDCVPLWETKINPLQESGKK